MPAAEEEEAGDEDIDEGGILADLAAFERGLGDAGTGEKIVRKGGPLRDWSTPGVGRPNWGRRRFKEFWDQSNCSAMRPFIYYVSTSLFFIPNFHEFFFNNFYSFMQVLKISNYSMKISSKCKVGNLIILF